MTNIDTGKLREFIDDNQTEKMSRNEVFEKTGEIKLNILIQAEQELKKAYEKGNTAMVSSIAAILENV